MNKQKGFTIIELIVVIAIIAILASIVLVNVTQYINKAKDAVIIEYVHQVQGASATVYASNSAASYSGLASDATYLAIVAKMANSTTNLNLKNDNSVYCFTATMPSGATSWCTDSTGYVGTLAGGKCTGSIYTCQ